MLCVLENCPSGASNLIATFIDFHVDGHELDQINNSAYKIAFVKS